MNFLGLVNEVLIRLREQQVDSVNLTEYSTLIGRFVNEAKREVEDAHNWSVLHKNINITATNPTVNYTLGNSNNRTRIDYCYNSTKKWMLRNLNRIEMASIADINYTPSTNDVLYYSIDGRNSNGNIKIKVYPIPISTQTLTFKCIVPQNNLVANTDVISIPEEPVILNAYLRAISERGEDNGRLSDMQSAQYTRSLQDHIAIDKNYNDSDTLWSAV
jgi:hypothetical protein